LGTWPVAAALAPIVVLGPGGVKSAGRARDLTVWAALLFRAIFWRFCRHGPAFVFLYLHVPVAKAVRVPASEVLLSPILVRPVREQLEHDRVIRLLQAKYKRKFEVAINPGNEQTAPVGPPAAPWYPDLVLQSGERTKKLQGVVEVETAESLNNLEAMSQWVTFAKLRVPFHLYVPA